MTPTKHTPGPWFVTKDEADFLVVTPDSQCPSDWIACLDNEDEQKEANAKLIAAAPELLELVQAILPQAKNWVSCEKDSEWIEKAKAAIQKATQ